jgi:hypothetical protein
VAAQGCKWVYRTADPAGATVRSAPRIIGRHAKAAKVSLDGLCRCVVFAWRLAAFSRQLQKLGWMEGKNISFEIRHAAGNPDQFPAMATELVGTSPDVILAGTAGLAAVARKATGTIPIVVVNAGELEGTGLIASLRRPGGNVTGALVHRGRQRAADQPVLEPTFRAACICHEARSPSCVPGPTRPA